MNALILLVAGLGLVFVILSAARLRGRRFFAAAGHGMTGALLLAIGAVLGAVALDLHSYRRLTHERPAARLLFQRLAPTRFHVTLIYPSGERGAYTLLGDEWQLDARVLKWKGVANLLGLDTEFRLERLSGRYQDLEQALTGPRSIYPLATGAGMDIWRLARRHPKWMPWVDATYGNATYMPMANNAAYLVLVTTSGLIARPINQAARQAVARWR